MMNELPQTRQSLLLRLQHNSDDAWTEFIQIYEQAIYDYCRKRGLQDADARDVTQEVLTVVDQKVAQWKHDASKGKFRGWLFRVARNIAVTTIYKKSKRVAGTGDTRVAHLLNQLPESEADQSTAFWLEYRRSLMNWAAKKVKSEVQTNSWQAFWRTAVQGSDPQQVAIELGTTVGSVYTAKCRVFARMKKVMLQLDDDHEFDPANCNPIDSMESSDHED